MDRNDLHGKTVIGILRDLEDLGLTLPKDATDAITGRLAVALATSYKDGYADALLAVMSKFRRHIDKTA